jgi:hypothetical protein
VLKKNHRALVVYGDGHLLSSEPLGGNTLVTILKRESNARIFTISNGYPDLSRFQTNAAWPVPSRIMVKALLSAPNPAPRVRRWNRISMPCCRGPSALSLTEVQKGVCNDPEYLKMRFDRFALTATPDNPDPGAELKRLFGGTGVR